MCEISTIFRWVAASQSPVDVFVQVSKDNRNNSISIKDKTMVKICPKELLPTRLCWAKVSKDNSTNSKEKYKKSKVFSSNNRITYKADFDMVYNVRLNKFMKFSKKERESYQGSRLDIEKLRGPIRV